METGGRIETIDIIGFGYSDGARREGGQIKRNNTITPILVGGSEGSHAIARGTHRDPMPDIRQLFRTDGDCLRGLTGGKDRDMDGGRCAGTAKVGHLSYIID